MPLTSRRPQFLTISITGPDSTSPASSDGLRTPAPVTPLAYPATIGQPAPMAMTPDTPAFGCSPLDGLGPKVDMAGKNEVEVPWSEEEDAILQTALLRPAGKAYPPGTLPPAEHLDRLANDIIARYTSSPANRRLKRGRSSSMSSIAMSPITAQPLPSPTANRLEVVTELFTPTEPSFLALPQRQATGTPGPEAGANVAGDEISPDWPHSWSATRKRLFEIARLESRAAVGGHRRNQSESFVPISADKLNMPHISFGPSTARQSGGSFDGAYGDKPQTITEAVRLSSHLQGQAMESSPELHSGKGLFSPVKIEFGGQVNFSASNAQPLAKPNPIIRKAASTLPPARPALTGRPSLLQRGISYTTADLAHMTHSRNASSSSDVTMTDVSIGSPGSTETSPTSIADRDATMEGDDDALDSFGRSAESVMFAFSCPQRDPSLPASTAGPTQDTEDDPFTPLHQIAFPASVHGLGPRRIGQSPDGTPASHNGSTPDKGPSTMTNSGENSPLPSAYPSSQTTPRMGDAVFGNVQRDHMLSNDSSEPIFDFDRLSISNTDEKGYDASPFGLLNSTFTFGAPTQATAIFQAPRMTRSRSELSPLSGHLGRLPPSISIPNNLAAHAGPEPLSPSAAGHRESKRQRGCVSAVTVTKTPAASSIQPMSSSMSGSGRRLNPGLTVIVPTNNGLGKDSLRSPFEHKIPNTNGSLLTRE